MYLEEYKEYFNLIKKCKNKKYEAELVLHKHHIIPSFMDPEGLYKDEVVMLSVDDHIKAHFKLSKCFEQGSYEKVGNLRAVKLLSKKSIKYRDELLEIYESQRGENNPAKNPENRKKIAEGLIKYYKNTSNPKKGKTYEEIYGERAEIEKTKRKKNTRTKESYIIGAKKASEKLKGRVSYNAQQTCFRGIMYRSLAEASKQTGVSKYKIQQELAGAVKRIYAHTVTIHGVEYPSINQACKALKITPFKLKKQFLHETDI